MPATLLATTGATLDLESIIVTNTGTVLVDATLSILDLESATISGGILTNHGTVQSTGGTNAISNATTITNDGHHGGDGPGGVLEITGATTTFNNAGNAAGDCSAPRSISRASSSPTPAPFWSTSRHRSWIWRAPPSAAAS